MKDPILLTPGPLTTSRSTKEAMLRDWGSWFHRTQASALAALEDSDAEEAIAEIDSGLEMMRTVFEEHEAEEEFEQDEMVLQLAKLRDSLKEEYLGPSLEERLEHAVKSEEYELAARLRDELARKQEN